MQEYYTTQEAAKLLRVSTRTIMRYIQAGKFRGLKCGIKPDGTGRWRIDKASFDQFLTNFSYESQDEFTGKAVANAPEEYTQHIDEYPGTTESQRHLYNAMKPLNDILTEYRNAVQNAGARVITVLDKFTKEADKLADLLANITDINPKETALAEKRIVEFIKLWERTRTELKSVTYIEAKENEEATD